mgnify:CR=1 FL=1
MIEHYKHQLNQTISRFGGRRSSVSQRCFSPVQNDLFLTNPILHPRHYIHRLRDRLLPLSNNRIQDFRLPSPSLLKGRQLNHFNSLSLHPTSTPNITLRLRQRHSRSHIRSQILHLPISRSRSSKSQPSLASFAWRDLWMVFWFGGLVEAGEVRPWNIGALLLCLVVGLPGGL